MGKWYKQGRKDALAGLPKDPPRWQGHPSHMAYVNGWQDGQQELDDRTEAGQ